MCRVIFMCGPSGSGKSTYARRLEGDGMVRLSFDVEMWHRGISTVPLPPDVRDEIEAGLRARLLELVAAGRDVVLDFSFWSRRMRDDYRRLLAAHRCRARDRLPRHRPGDGPGPDAHQAWQSPR